MIVSTINILLSFDYELPLGGVNGSFDESLFEPTSALLEEAERLDVPLNFFADILSVVRFKELGQLDYPKAFIDQMQFAYKARHDVQLHLHPHWLDTNIVDDKFETSDNYGLGDFDSFESINKIVKTGVKELMNITEGESPCAFRAGGYVLAPKTKEILKALRVNGIKIDSSICHGYYFKSHLSEVNYTNVPKLANWKLDMQGDFTKFSDDGLFEIPIAGKSKSLLEVPTAFKMKKYAHRKAEASGKMIHVPPAQLTIKEKMLQVLSSRMLTFDNYTYDLNFNSCILKNYLQRFNREKDIYVAAIGHPKTMGPYGLQLLSSFIEDTRAFYGNRVNFITYEQAKNELGL